MNTYEGLHAAYYDVIFADKPYDEEARFVARVLGECGARPGGKLLDVACGTGRHAIQFAQLGYEVTGIDISEELLARARRNAKQGQVAVRFITHDMRELAVDGGPFDAVTCLFDSIGYAVTGEGVLAALRAIHSQLAPEGVFAAEFLHAAAMLRYADPVRVRRWRAGPGRELLRISETRLDPELGTYRVRYELLELSEQGRYKRATEEHVSRFFSVEEMRLLLEAAGLRTLTFVAAYDVEPAITEQTWHVLAVARQA